MFTRLTLGLSFLTLFAGSCLTSSAEAVDSSFDLGGTSWRLIRFQNADRLTLTPDRKDQYTIAFGAYGKLNAQINCNLGRGTWTSVEKNQIELGPLALTRIGCPPSPIEDHITKDWQEFKSYTIRDGHLFLKSNSGTYEFEPMSRNRIERPEQTKSPGPDSFYDPPGNPPATPGSLIRNEPFARRIPARARAWRILYTTTRDDHTPAIGSALVIASGTPPGSGSQPILAWNHGTTGVAVNCAPSVLPDPFGDRALPSLHRILAEGWVFVGTDYTGLGTTGPHPFLVGDAEARSVLDAVRAARQLKELRLDNRTVIWGHSQGGHAALWTGILAPQYAPDIHVVGIAAIAPASNLAALLDKENLNSPFSKIISAYLATTWSQIYPEFRFEQLVPPKARDIAHDIANRCLIGSDARLSASDASDFEGPMLQFDIALSKRLSENTPHDPISAPLLILQGESDQIIPAVIQNQFVKDRCAAGQSLEYRTYKGGNHLSIVAPNSAATNDLIQWTQDRLAGKPQKPGCQSITN